MSTGAGAKIKGESHNEARGAERVDLQVSVDFQSDHNFYTGLTQNISTGGLFIATHQMRRIGDRIRVSFSLPGAPAPISVETEVRWLRESTSLQRFDGSPGMGVRFVSLSPEAMRAIGAFLQDRDSLFYDDE
jgi:uncharacterized protein (TIGR02266 family)